MIGPPRAFLRAGGARTRRARPAAGSRRCARARARAVRCARRARRRSARTRPPARCSRWSARSSSAAARRQVRAPPRRARAALPARPRRTVGTPRMQPWACSKPRRVAGCSLLSALLDALCLSQAKRPHWQSGGRLPTRPPACPQRCAPRASSLAMAAARGVRQGAGAGLGGVGVSERGRPCLAMLYAPQFCATVIQRRKRGR